ncbi:MAG: site-specific DNA-methyltransferase, partial [Anaerolineae bacterium]|nr:site-specific DNA-methyltransferase [Anaerolineae bacterium]
MGNAAIAQDQLALFTDIEAPTTPGRGLTTDAFSHGDVSPQTARCNLEASYAHLLKETDQFNRQLVSFQTNKTEMLHGWISYREGFSATLVERLLQEFGVEPGDVVLDPFAGSCTTLLTAKMLGID